MKTTTSTHHFFPHVLSLHFFLFSLFFFISSATSHYDFAVNGVLTDAGALYIKQRQLLYYRDEFGDRGEFVTVNPSLVFPNPRLRTAYIAFQAWKEAIFSDPQNLTADWVGSGVCNYTGVSGLRRRTTPRSSPLPASIPTKRHRRVPPGGARTPHRSRIVSHQLESILRHRPSQVQELEAPLRARSLQQKVRRKIPSGVSKIAESEILRPSFQRVRRQCPHSGVHFSRIDYSLVRLLV
ncbi:hypothetical protein TEA_019576 [Camellia sinensis var. sinensis]|uniref:Uncharacterized protein n=1 Tax=Camellia sinensis var. sinensis TaxID=542762 RepID=A0A4S4DI24_CAMSN|nr:hypothetical protein TEA_019576 [Camellia sinensis var. sinensis]